MSPLSQVDFAKSLAYDIEMTIKEPMPELYALIDAFQHYMATDCIHQLAGLMSVYGSHIDMLQDICFCYHHQIIHKTWGIEELIKYTDKYWAVAKTNITSVAIKQFTAHRCAGDKQFGIMSEFYRDSIIRAKQMGIMKWVVSGYCYWARYADFENKEQILLEMFAFNDYTSGISYECFTDKVLRGYIWLKCFGATEKAKEITGKYDVMLKKNEKLCYLTTLTNDDIEAWRTRFKTEPDKFTGLIYHP